MVQGAVVLRCNEFQKRCAILIVPLLVSIFIATTCYAFLLPRTSPRSEPTLRLLSIIHRHGRRSPENFYPLDPYKDESFWPDGMGQLTQTGKTTLFELGKALRYQYDGFLSSRYKSTELSVVSSHFDRCIMSAQLLLAGLFPPVGNQIWNSDLLWQPIPVHDLPPSSDDMVRVTKPCPLLLEERNHLFDNVFGKIMHENKAFITYLAQKTGSEIKNHLDVWSIYDALLIEEEQGFKLPDWTRDIYPDKIKPIALMFNLAIYDTPTLRKLHSGVLINDILSNMKKKAAGEFERRLNLYSAHDVTIARLWRIMNVTQELTEIPGYGASFTLELHEIKDKYRVRILYKDHALDKESTVLRIKGCENDQAVYQDEMCDLDVFSSALQSVTITDFDKECQIPK